MGTTYSFPGFFVDPHLVLEEENHG